MILAAVHSIEEIASSLKVTSVQGQKEVVDTDWILVVGGNLAFVSNEGHVISSHFYGQVVTASTSKCKIY